MVDHTTTVEAWPTDQLRLTAPVTGSVLAPPRVQLLALKLPPPGGTLLALQLTVPLGALAELGVLSVTVPVQLVRLHTHTSARQSRSARLWPRLRAITTTL